MNFLDLFSGIWWVKIGFENQWYTCVFSNDFDQNCQKTYDLNFSHKKPMILKSITDIEIEELPDVDILTGWFPCQPFSIAWYRKGFSDWGRGDLFFDIVRILKAKTPRAFLLENVKNLKTHDNGNTLKLIYKELESLGYHVTDMVMNSMEYWNIPQNRERVYIVGFLNKKEFDDFSFPWKIPLELSIHDCLEENVDKKYYYNDKPLYDRLKNDVSRTDTIYQWRRKYVRENKNQVCPTLTANMWTGGHNVPIILDNKGIRKITPRECANFQWFPKSYKLPQIADSHLYKQFWNSVSIPVIERIARNMKLALI